MLRASDPRLVDLDHSTHASQSLPVLRLEMTEVCCLDGGKPLQLFRTLLSILLTIDWGKKGQAAWPQSVKKKTLTIFKY